MKNRDYFLLREVILGLRSEYQENQKKLEDLKKYVSVNNKRVEDLSFYIKRIDNYYYMILNITKRQNVIQNLLDRIEYNLANKKPVESVLIDYVNLTRKNYFICTDQNKVSVKDTNGFYASVDHILMDDFNTNLFNEYYKIPNEDMSTKVNHSGIYTITSNYRNVCPNTGVDYHSADDTLIVNRYYNSSPNVGIYRVLDARIPKNYLSETTRNIIENNEETSAQIVFEGLDCSRDEQVFKFDKQDDKMYLRRVK